MVRGMMVAVVAVVSLASALTVVVGADVANPDPYRTLLDDYQAIMPGQPASALDAYECAYLNISSYFPESASYCQIEPASGDVTQIDVLMLAGGINRISFKVEHFAVADLIHHFGRPNVIKARGSSYLLCWSSGIIATARAQSPFTLRASVEFITVFRIESLSDQQPATPQLTDFLCPANAREK